MFIQIMIHPVPVMMLFMILSRPEPSIVTQMERTSLFIMMEPETGMMITETATVLLMMRTFTIRMVWITTITVRQQTFPICRLITITAKNKE